MKLQMSLILVGLALAYAQNRPITRTKKGPPPPSHVVPPQRQPHRVPGVHGVPPPRRRGPPPVRSSLPVRKYHYNDVPDNSGSAYPHRTHVVRGSIPKWFKPARRPTSVLYPAPKPKHHPSVLTRTKSAGFLGGPMRYVPPAQPYTMPTTYPPPPPPTTVYYLDTPDVKKEEEEEEES